MYADDHRASYDRSPPPDLEDIYDVYAGLLSDPPLSHPNNDVRYVIVDASLPITGRESPARGCSAFARNHPASFNQIREAHDARKTEPLHLERKFRIAKPYILIPESEIRSVVGWPVKLPMADESVTKSIGPQDLIRLSNVFFDKDRKFAMVYMSAMCGTLCGYWGWNVLQRLPDGSWQMDRSDPCAHTIS
jgi:hypothetical protein